MFVRIAPSQGSISPSTPPARAHTRTHTHTRTYVPSLTRLNYSARRWGVVVAWPLSWCTLPRAPPRARPPPPQVPPSLISGNMVRCMAWNVAGAAVCALGLQLAVSGGCGRTQVQDSRL